MDKVKLDGLKAQAYDKIKSYEIAMAKFKLEVEKVQNKHKGAIMCLQKDLASINQEISDIETKEKKSG